MKKAIRILTITLAMLQAVQVLAGGIEFDHEIAFQDALDKAKREGKLVFIDCYTSWCGPCKRLAATTFMDSAVGQYFNNNYINIQVDMEKGEGPQVATRYQITAYPTMLWLDANGSVKKRTMGLIDAPTLMSSAHEAADPLPDIMNDLNKKYSAGERSQAFMEDYLKNFKASGRNYDAVFAEYLAQAQKQGWAKESTLMTIYQMTNSYESPGLEALQKDKSGIAAKVGEKAYDQKLLSIAKDAAETARRKTDPKVLAVALDLTKKAGGAESKKAAAKMEMDYYFNTANADTYDKYVSEYIKKYAPNDAKLLNDVAWQYYINTNDDKYLKKASQWAYKAVNLQNNSTNNTTYAYLQYKLGNKSEATKACDYAIIKAKEEKVNPLSAQALKDAIKKDEAAAGAK
ncbi:MAG: thioredoxin family protein [Bacteroidetes bacterium]|nr:thioredoxin family protein [Bacteroidota bacterium]